MRFNWPINKQKSLENLTFDIERGIHLPQEILTNFPAEQEPIYRQAIELAGEQDNLEIRNEAFNIHGDKISEYKALARKSDKKDFSNFWAVFRELKNG